MCHRRLSADDDCRLPVGCINHAIYTYTNYKSPAFVRNKFFDTPIFDLKYSVLLTDIQHYCGLNMLIFLIILHQRFTQ